jgi:hypothetical protein
MASKRWTWATAAALLFAGLTNAHSHVHYCFDGKAPAASVHRVDGRDHSHDIPSASHHASGDDHFDHDAVHDEHTGHDDHDADHDDLDLDVPNAALAKTLKHDLPALAAAPLWSVSLDHEADGQVAAEPDVFPAPDPPYSRPFLRAPPR